jgi:TPR repeat protein
MMKQRRHPSILAVAYSVTGTLVVLSLAATTLASNVAWECAKDASPWLPSLERDDGIAQVSCSSTTTGPMRDVEGSSPQPGSLRPSDLPSPEIFMGYDKDEKGNVITNLVDLPGKSSQPVRTGQVTQINPVNAIAHKVTSEVAVLPQLVDAVSVQALLKLLRAYQSFDQDPDTADGMATYEMYVDSPNLGGNNESMKVLDYDPQALPERNRLRDQLRSILHPIVAERITPFVRQHYPQACHRQALTDDDDDDSRDCTPCYSLIRRYRHGERQSLSTHHDGDALITVVVSLSNYGTDYLGGLYVSTGHGQRQFLNLSAGDAVSHQSSLLHGVQVLDIAVQPNETVPRTERWSWVLWYRDSVQCRDYSYEWFQTCSDLGDAVCQELHATKAENIPHLTALERVRLILELNRAAAEQGNGNAAIKMARVYHKHLPSILKGDKTNLERFVTEAVQRDVTNLERFVTEAVRFYRLAIESHHPDGHFGMANLYLMSLAKSLANATLKGSNTTLDTETRQLKQETLTKVLGHLEEAAYLGHEFAMFNLGIAHVYGYGTPDNRIDTDLAVAWLVQSGLPEGYFVASQQAASNGDTARHKLYDDRARSLDFYQPWRKEKRLKAGIGGTGGVDINMQWPPAFDGRQPPVV